MPALMMNKNGSAMANYPKAEKEMKEQIRATLGDERCVAYECAQDQTNQQFWTIVRQAGLEAAAANEVYEVKRAVDAQVAEAYGNPSLSVEERRTAIESISHDAERSAQQTPGDEVWKRYDLRNNMWWLRGLTQQSGSMTIESSSRN